jgi:hypothetical protein
MSAEEEELLPEVLEMVVVVTAPPRIRTIRKVRQDLSTGLSLRQSGPQSPAMRLPDRRVLNRILTTCIPRRLAVEAVRFGGVLGGGWVTITFANVNHFGPALENCMGSMLPSVNRTPS